MPLLAQQQNSLDHNLLLQTLKNSEDFLIIQDLDGVCMELVNDPMTRTLSPHYLAAVRRLEDQFFVLTNGEHIGPRGVNGIVERTLKPSDELTEGWYLPGLAAGGVQWQDRFGLVDHPGVSDQEIQFLRSVPKQINQLLRPKLMAAPFALPAEKIDSLLHIAILDNPVSPTFNSNVFIAALADDWQLYRQLQHVVVEVFAQLLAHAAEQELADSFFVHYAPNLGSNANGERIKWATEQSFGTTDFQFMLSGAVKEVGVLVILNRYCQQKFGRAPLGESFNARSAPKDHAALLALAHQHFSSAQMPRIIAVGDTVTSQLGDAGEFHRGGSDRGFLSLVQALGEQFHTDNAICFVDSSQGELDRPKVDASALRNSSRPSDTNALAGISDAQDPLHINFIFDGGYKQYVDFFCQLTKHA